MTARVQLETLGSLQVRLDGRELTGLRRKERVLIAYLARHDGRANRAELATLLWGERDEASARHSLRQAIFAINRATGLIEVEGESIRIDPQRVVLDLDQLEQDIRAGRSIDAFDRWHGDFLAGLEDLGSELLKIWIEGERAALDRLLASAVARLLNTPAEQYQGGDVIVDFTRRRKYARPYDEAAHIHFIVALQKAGKLEEAVAEYARSHKQLQQVMEIEPSAEFRALGERLLATSTGSDNGNELLQGLLFAWEQVAQGDGRVIRIEQKNADECSRITSQLLTAITRRTPAAVVLNGESRSWPREPWSGARLLLRNLRNAPGLSGVDDAVLAEAARVLPSIRERFPRLPAASGDDAALQRAIIQTLRDVAAEVPVLMVVPQARALDPSTRTLVDALAAETAAGLMLVQLESAPARPRRFYRTVVLAASVAMMLLAAYAFVRVRPRESSPVVAVGTIGGEALATNDAVARALPQLIASQLAQSAELEVISRARMQELLARVDNDLAAARAARASLLVEGDVQRDGDNYHLELRQLDVKSGRLRSVTTLRAGSAAQLAQQVAALVSRNTGVTVPTSPEATPAIPAIAWYEEGLRELYRSTDARLAFTYFQRALAEDSTFVLAAYHAARLAPLFLRDSIRQYTARAERLAQTAPDHERLLIKSYLAGFYNEPSAIAVAETLAIRYPHDPAAATLLATARVNAGDFLGAVDEYERAVELDRLAGATASATCATCEALSGVILAYWAADSLAAALRTTEYWISFMPDHPSAWTNYAALLEYSGQFARADSALSRAAELGLSAGEADLARVRRMLRAADFENADRILSVLAQSTHQTTRTDALWWQVISFRYQGRFKEAFAAAQRFRAMTPGAGGWIPMATALTDAGNGRLAAELFDSAYQKRVDTGKQSRNARDQVWFLTHAGTNAALTGDYQRVARLADSVRIIGARSGYARDVRLHHHLRGLQYVAANDWPRAEQSFRAATYSLTMGYTRTSVELARTLLEQKRAGEAIPILQGVLRGSLDGSPLYANRADVHELLGDAFAVAQQPDSAGRHYRWVLAAWRNADPALQDRRTEVRRKLAEL